MLIQIERLRVSDVESDDYSESARSYELGKVSDFACARPRPDFSAFLCLWRKLTIGWEMRPVRLVLQNIRNFFSQNGWCLPFTKNSRSCKGSNKAESAGAKGQRKAWRAAFHDLYGCPPTFNITDLEYCANGTYVGNIATVYHTFDEEESGSTKVGMALPFFLVA